jgi:hypothetical protein
MTHAETTFGGMIASMSRSLADTWSWLAWSGWAGIGTIAQILSLIALAFAIYELVARSHSVQGAFSVHHFASRKRDGRDQFIVEITNIGGAQAVILQLDLYGADVIPDPDEDYLVKYAMLPAQTMTLAIQSDDLKKAWVRIRWVSPVDRRYQYGMWRPLRLGSPLADEFEASNIRTPEKHWWTAPIRTRFPRPVGPGHDVATRLRMSWNKAKLLARLERAFPTETSPTQSWQLGGMTNPEPIDETTPEN